MQDVDTFDIEALWVEIERYLAAVETFRHQGCEPRWAVEVKS